MLAANAPAVLEYAGKSRSERTAPTCSGWFSGQKIGGARCH